MKTMVKNILILLLFLSIAVPSFATTYYVSTDGNDKNPGTKNSPWRRCPGMAGWSSSVKLKAGDTVYFNSSDTWTLSDGSYGFWVTGGVTYIGDTWGNGKRAKFDVTSRYSANGGVLIAEDHPTIETEFKGFEVDCNMTESRGIQINYGSMRGWETVGAVKRVENCHVHHTGKNSATYGITASTHHNSTTKNIEIIDCIVHDVGHNAICLYAGYRSNNALISDVVIRGCETYKTGLRSSYGGPAGIQIKNHVENVIVENNKLHNSDLGIKIYKEYVNALPIKNITIRYNEIAHNDSAGIYVYNGPSSNVYIYGNSIYKNGRSGIKFESNLYGTLSYNISENLIHSNGQYQIVVNSSKADFKTLVISKNKLCGANFIYDPRNVITENSENEYLSNCEDVNPTILVPLNKNFKNSN